MAVLSWVWATVSMVSVYPFRALWWAIWGNLAQMAELHEGYGEEEDGEAGEYNHQRHVAAALAAMKFGCLGGRGAGRKIVDHRVRTA